MIEQCFFKSFFDRLEIIVVKHSRLLLVLKVLFEFVDVFIRLSLLIDGKLTIVKVVSLLFVFFQNLRLDYVDLVLKFALVLLVYLFVKDFSVELSKGFRASSVESVC